MQLTHLLPIFWLAVAGTDFLVAMRPDEAAAAISSSNAETETHHPGASSTNTQTEEHHDHDVDNEGTIGSILVGSSGKSTEFLFVDTHEPIALDYGPEYHLKLKNVQIRVGSKQLQSAISKHKHKSPSAARIELTLDDQQNPDLKTPKDLAGIELEIVYGFGEDCENHGIHWMYQLSNRKDEKKVTVKIPKMENAPTKDEKEILKGIFIGGHKFKLEVLSNGNAEIKFQKNLSPGTMKFTAVYKNVRTGNGEMVEVLYKQGKNYGLKFESISLPESTFTINWAASAGIKEVEKLRTVTISVYFKLKDGKGKDNKVTESERGGLPLLRSIPLRDLNEDILEQLFVGGQQATIHLSGIDSGKSRIEIGADALTKPKSSVTMKFTTVYSNFSTGKGQIVEASYSVGEYYGLKVESISKSKSTFTINWAAAGIKEVEELRAVIIYISFKLSDDKHHNLTENERPTQYRSIPLQNLEEETLKQLFVGGEATINLSKVGESRIEIVTGPKPKSSVFETVKAMVGI